MATRYYPAVLEQAPDGFSVFFPDFDGCVSHGATTEEAAREAEQALALHLRGMIADGDAIPDPTPLERVERDPEVEEFARILVRAELPGRAVRLNISMEEELIAAVDAAAAQEGNTRSGMIAKALRGKLEQVGPNPFKLYYLETTGKRLLRVPGANPEGSAGTVRTERFATTYEAFVRMFELMDDPHATGVWLNIPDGFALRANDLREIMEHRPRVAAR